MFVWKKLNLIYSRKILNSKKGDFDDNTKYLVIKE